MNDQPALFRYTDPATSRAAAASINAHVVEMCVLGAFAMHGELTDDELCDVLEDKYPPTVKTARSRLHKAGALKDTGARRPSNRGRAMIVWAEADRIQPQ